MKQIENIKAAEALPIIREVLNRINNFNLTYYNENTRLKPDLWQSGEPKIICEIEGKEISNHDLFNSVFNQFGRYIDEFKPRIFIFVLLRDISALYREELIRLFKRFDVKFLFYDLQDLITEIGKYPDLINRLEEKKDFSSVLSKEIDNINTPHEPNYFLAGSTWGDGDRAPHFFSENIWETGDGDRRFSKVINSAKAGDIIFLKSAFPSGGISYLRIKGMGTVTQNPLSGTKLYVNWTLKYIREDIPNLGKYRSTFARVMPEDLPRIFTAIQNTNTLSEKEIEFDENSPSLNFTEEFSESNIEKEEASNSFNYTKVSNDQVADSKDLLGFEKDVRSFATIMSLKAVQPPLAIALFGNWGTGKSFFMNNLQNDINHLSRYQAFIGMAPRDINNKLFCEGILQIKFNAWSYLDANLWAGLVANIFEKIDEYISEQTKGSTEKQKVQNVLREKLEIIGSNKIEAVETIDELSNKKNVITNQIEQLKIKQKTLIQNIADQKFDDIIKEIKKKVNLDPIIQDQLDKYGITKEKLEEISPDALYDEFTSWVTFFKNFFQLSKRSIILLSSAAIIVLLLWINPENILEDLKLIGRRGVLTFFSIAGPLFYSFYKSYSHFKKLLHPITKFKDDFNQEMEKEKFNYTKQADLLKSEVEQINNNITIKKIELKQIEEQAASVEYELKYSITKRAFYSFIKAKSKDEKYEKHLGIISTIRRDFETLSELFLEHTSETNITEENQKKIEQKQKEYLEFKDQFKKPLDRIILYIDDLDRCSEEKVLEVLQAVHLLMAFPLFIVVVGVDKRCVNNALNYKNLLQYKSLTADSTTEELNSHGIQIIHPNEYLEKIFQIPFHIQEASSDDVKNMIDKLLTGQVHWEDLEIKNGDITIESLNQEIPTENFSGWQKEVQETINPIVDMNPSESDKKDNLTVIEDLIISGTEFKLLKEISWIVDNTPRAIKRFLNLYRIVRAHEHLSYQRERRNEEFMIIMFLLGIYNGPYYLLSKGLVKFYRDARDNNNSDDFDYSLNGFLSAFYDDRSDKHELSQKLKLKLSSCLSFKNILFSDVELFQKHLPFIQRFSFN